MPVIQKGNGFIAEGAITHHQDRVFVDGHDVNRLLQMAHSDHLCETPGGGDRPCRRVRLEATFFDDLEA